MFLEETSEPYRNSASDGDPLLQINRFDEDKIPILQWMHTTVAVCHFLSLRILVPIQNCARHLAINSNSHGVLGQKFHLKKDESGLSKTAESIGGLMTLSRCYTLLYRRPCTNHDIYRFNYCTIEAPCTLPRLFTPFKLLFGRQSVWHTMTANTDSKEHSKACCKIFVCSY